MTSIRQSTLEIETRPTNELASSVALTGEMWVNRFDKFERFMELPRELRDIIYTLAMEDLPTRFTIRERKKLSKMVLYPHVLPSICFTTPAVREEVILAYIRRTRFVLESADHWRHETPQKMLVDFLAQFPDNSGYKAIRMLSFHDYVISYASPFGGSLDLHRHGFITRFTGLRSLIVDVAARVCVGQDENGDDRLLLKAEETKEKYHCSEELEAKTLRHFKVVCLSDPIHRHVLRLELLKGFFVTLVTLLVDEHKRRDSPLKMKFLDGKFEANWMA
jgi:hypothetical protein